MIIAYLFTLSNVNHKISLNICNVYFRNCTKLKQMYLAGNNISYIENRAFDGLFHFEMLDLDGKVKVKVPVA